MREEMREEVREGNSYYISNYCCNTSLYKEMVCLIAELESFQLAAGTQWQ